MLIVAQILSHSSKRILLLSHFYIRNFENHINDNTTDQLEHVTRDSMIFLIHTSLYPA
jgi:hypothetical protein